MLVLSVYLYMNMKIPGSEIRADDRLGLIRR